MIFKIVLGRLLHEFYKFYDIIWTLKNKIKFTSLKILSFHITLTVDKQTMKPIYFYDRNVYNSRFRVFSCVSQFFVTKMIKRIVFWVGPWDNAILNRIIQELFLDSPRIDLPLSFKTWPSPNRFKKYTSDSWLTSALYDGGLFSKKVNSVSIHKIEKNFVRNNSST